LRDGKINRSRLSLGAGQKSSHRSLPATGNGATRTPQRVTSECE